MDIRMLMAFAEVAEARSISVAADRLGYSQPAVSRQLAALERLVGARLYKRVRGGVALTPEGHDILPRVRGMIALADMIAGRPGRPDHLVMELIEG